MTRHKSLSRQHRRAADQRQKPQVGWARAWWIVAVGAIAVLALAVVVAPHATWSSSDAGQKPRRTVRSTQETDRPQEAPQAKAGASQRAVEPADPLLEAPVEDLKKKDLEVARRLLTDFPNSAEAMSMVGMVYNSQGNSAEAIKCWERSLEMNPRRADAFHGMGWIAFLKADYAGAVAHWTKALSVDPSMPGLRNAMARALMNQNRAKEAIAVLEEGMRRSAGKSTTGGEDYFLLGQAHLQLKDYEQAKNNYETALTVNPEYKQPYYGLSTVYTRLGQREKAKQYAAKFRELRAQYLDDLIDRTSTFDDRVAMRRSLAQTYVDAGRVYAREGYLLKAEEHWLQAARLDPKSTDCRLELASYYQRVGREAESLQRCEELCRIEPHSALHYLRAGALQQRLQQFEAAGKSFRRVVELAPQRSEGYSALVQLALATGTGLGEAKGQAARAVELEPTARNYHLLAQACLRTGDRKGAATAIGEAVKQEPNSAEYRRLQEMLRGKG